MSDNPAPTPTSDLFSVAGKTVLVTGGTTGIGRMIAGGFVAGGAKVLVASRKEEAVQETIAELSEFGEISGTTANLSTEDGARDLAAWVADSTPTVDVLVNNAGATWGVPLEEHDDAAWSRVLDLNVKGVFHMTKFLLPQLRAAGSASSPSRVINIGSIDGIGVPMMETYSYSASKAAVHQLTRHLATQLSPEITVNAIAPGPFPSKMMAATLDAFSDDIVNSTPMRRIGEPDDMAGVAMFLASKAGSYVTGTIITVDGGMSLTR